MDSAAVCVAVSLLTGSRAAMAAMLGMTGDALVPVLEASSTAAAAAAPAAPAANSTMNRARMGVAGVGLGQVRAAISTPPQHAGEPAILGVTSDVTRARAGATTTRTRAATKTTPPTDSAVGRAKVNMWDVEMWPVMVRMVWVGNVPMWVMTMVQVPSPATATPLGGGAV